MKMYHDYNPYLITVYERGSKLRLCPEEVAWELFSKLLVKELLHILGSDTKFNIQTQQQWKVISRRLKKAGWRLPNRWMSAIDSFCMPFHFVWIEHPVMPNVKVELKVEGSYVESISTMVYRR